MTGNQDSLRALALRAIEDIADELRKAEPALTAAAAIVKAAATPKGRDLYQLYSDRSAHLPVDEWIQKNRRERQLAALGFRDWSDAVAQLAKAFGNGDVEAGLVEVQKRAPTVFENYLRAR